jgi:hypothetical protein
LVDLENTEFATKLNELKEVHSKQLQDQYWNICLKQKNVSINGDHVYCACGCDRTRPQINKNGKICRYIYRQFQVSFKGLHHSEATRKRMSESHKGKISTLSHRKKLSKAHLRVHRNK